MNDNQDILDLCRLNLMEENIAGIKETANASSQEIKNFRDAIKFGKQKSANRIIHSQKPASDKVLAQHRKVQI